MVDFECKERYDVSDLRRLVEHLRGEGGCPWDREQTHESIRRNFLEEAYEAVGAIDEKNPAHLQEELGDVLLQVVFHARMEEERGGFTLDDVADGICKKLILRHPHVFGDVKVRDSGEVLRNWDEIKRAEKHQETVTDAMDSVAKSLPALWRAEKVQKKAAKAGYDWPDASGAEDKIGEELSELRAAQDGAAQREELGDLLFSAVNAARHLGIDPEAALGEATDKFVARFGRAESAAAAEGKTLSALSPRELDVLWNESKKAGK